MQSSYFHTEAELSGKASLGSARDMTTVILSPTAR